MSTEAGSGWVNLLARVARGDQGALGELYDATSPGLLGLIRGIVEDVAAAEEIMLDVYAQVWRLAPAYSSEKGTPLTWLFMLGRSRAIDHLRSRARRARDRERPLEVAFDYSHPGPDPETSALSQDRKMMIQEALGELVPEQREVLQLAFFDGLTHTEIAGQTGLPLGTVKTRIRLAMVHMRESLAETLSAPQPGRSHSLRAATAGEPRP